MEVRQLDKLRWKRQITVPFTLDTMNQVMGCGPDVPTIRMAFLGEAPGQEEDEKGFPFIGPAGQYLHGYLKGAGIYSPGCYFTNVIDRRPPANNIKSPQAQEAIEVQRDETWAEFSWLASRGLTVVVALGNTAKDFFGITEPISKCRGSVYEVSLNWQGIVTDPTAEPCDFVVIPTYHPSYLRRGAGYQRKNDSTTMDLKLAWREDLKKAHDIAVKGYQRPVENFIYSPTLDQVVEWCQQRVAVEDLVAVDIETSGFSPKTDKIICIGMAVTDEDAICIPFYHTGPDVPRGTRYWTPFQEATIRQWIERVFAQCPLVLQNAIFDIGYLQEAGWQIEARAAVHDTLLAHHSIAAELPHNLGYIVSVYGSTPYWKGEFLTRDTTIWEMPFRDLQTYNMRDCIVLHQVMPPMLSDIEELGTGVAYDESLSLIGPVLEMQQTGALISTGRWNKWKKKIKANEEDLRRHMLEVGKLPPAFSFTPSEVLLLLYGIKSKAMTNAAQWEKHREGTATRESKRQLHELVQTVQPLWQHDYNGGRTSDGNPSLDKNGIAGLRIYASNRLAQLESLKRRTADHNREEEQLRCFTKWLDLYAEWKRVVKQEQMFRELPIRSDGRIHPQLLIFGTATGRLSCKSPNLQQWNKDDGADEGIREIIIAPKDFYIVAIDYQSLEFRIMAYECGDEKMLQIVEEGLDQHDENTRALFGIDKDHPKWKTYRAAAKTYQFASQYGAGNGKLHQTLTIRVPEANFTMADIKQMRHNFEKTYSGWSSWCKHVQKEAADTRKSSTAFGRIRILYGSDHEIKNQALNTPIQGGAAHIINGAMTRIHRRLHADGFRSRLQMQIHDELRFEVPEDELHRLCHLAVEEMERPIDYRGREVVFPVDVQYGRDWFHLQEYKR